MLTCNLSKIVHNVCYNIQVQHSKNGDLVYMLRQLKIMFELSSILHYTIFSRKMIVLAKDSTKVNFSCKERPHICIYPQCVGLLFFYIKFCVCGLYRLNIHP
jgi:hypothetical protein